MRVVFALAILVACARLFVAVEAPSTEGRGQHVDRHVKAAQENWLDTVEDIMNRPPLHALDPSRSFFDRIMVEVLRQDYEAAAAGFKLFLELHPASPLSVQADYWLGECEFHLGRYQEAIQSFGRVLARAPLNPQLAAAAFVRQGSSYAKLGEVHRSRRLLELLVVQFQTT